MVPGPSNGLPEKTTNCLYQLTCLLNTHLNYYKLILPMMLFFPLQAHGKTSYRIQESKWKLISFMHLHKQVSGISENQSVKVSMEGTINGHGI